MRDAKEFLSVARGQAIEDAAAEPNHPTEVQADLNPRAEPESELPDFRRPHGGEYSPTIERP